MTNFTVDVSQIVLFIGCDGVYRLHHYGGTQKVDMV